MSNCSKCGGSEVVMVSRGPVVSSPGPCPECATPFAVVRKGLNAVAKDPGDIGASYWNGALRRALTVVEPAMAVVMAERDAATRRAEEAEQQRDEHKSEMDRYERTWLVADASRKTAEAERDQLAAQLREMTTQVERLAASEMALREAMRGALRVLGPRSEEQSYGHFYGGDPRNFHPDEECSTEGEREAHRLACEAAERDEKARELPAAHQATTPDEAKRLMKSGEAVSAMIGPASAHVHMRGFGLGVTTFRDEEIVGVFDSLAAALATSAAESDAFVAGVRRAGIETALAAVNSGGPYTDGHVYAEIRNAIEALLAPAPTKTGAAK